MARACLLDVNVLLNPSGTMSRDEVDAWFSATSAIRRSQVDYMAVAAQGRALPTQDRAWLSCMAKRYGHVGKLARFELDPAEALLVADPSRPQRLVLLAENETNEPSDLAWDTAQQLDQLAAGLARQDRAVSLPRVPRGSPSIDALKRAFAYKGLVFVRPAIGTPYISLDDSWAEPAGKFNAGYRSDFRRAERHAQRQGELSFEIHTQLSASALDDLLDEAYAVEARSWKGECGTALQHDPQLGPFFRDYAHAAMSEGILRLAFMRIDGRAVGMQIAVEWQQSWWLLKIGYDTRYGRCSPGTLLMLHTVAEAVKRGLRSYEFLGRPAPWITPWTTDLKPCVHVRIYPFSVAGQLALAQDVGESIKVRCRKWWQSEGRDDGKTPAGAAA